MAALAVGAFAGSARAEESVGVDKSQYHLINPTPRDLMRPMSTDRPDTTESPISVDAGHYQIEFDAFSMARDEGAKSYALGTLNVKLGLTHRIDLQVVYGLYEHQGDLSGQSDLMFRTKVNLWGNEGGDTAFAVMPFVSLPTASEGLGSGYVEGGVVLPFGMELPAGFEFGSQVEVDAVRRLEGYGWEGLVSATTGTTLWKSLDGFVELTAVTPLDVDADLAVGANSGLKLGLSEDIVLDSGLRLGLTDAAEDLSIFVGGSARY